MRIISEKTLNDFRKRQPCQWCGRWCKPHPHHLWARGMGGAGRIDIRENLAALCVVCHNDAHSGKLLRADILAVVAKREGLMQDDITAEIHRIRRLPKGSVYVPFAGQRPVSVERDNQPNEVHRGPHRPRSFRGTQGMAADEGWQAFGDV